MDKSNGKLTVFFEEPFWIGVFERIEDGKLSVAKVTFGAEPKDFEVYEYILKYYYSLLFSPPVITVVKNIKRNPKRMQREAKKQICQNGIGTKSQQALKLQQEQGKLQRKTKSRQQKELEAIRMLELKQQKKSIKVISFIKLVICLLSIKIGACAPIFMLQVFSELLQNCSFRICGFS